MISLSPHTTALVLIDLQKPIVARPLSPRLGADVVKTAIGLAEGFRKANARVVLVNVARLTDFGETWNPAVDQPFVVPPGGLPKDWTELVDGLAQPTDLRVTKYQWGAFYGTDLDVQLRRRGIRTIVLGGIATNFGVESTAEQAWERGYDVVIAEDATASASAEMHAFSIGTMLPRISRVVNAADIPSRPTNQTPTELKFSRLLNGGVFKPGRKGNGREFEPGADHREAEERVADDENPGRCVVVKQLAQPMCDERTAVGFIARHLSKTVLKDGERADDAEPGLNHDQPDGGEVQGAKPGPPHPSPTEKSPAEYREQSEHDKRDEGDVRDQHEIGE